LESVDRSGQLADAPQLVAGDPHARGLLGAQQTSADAVLPTAGGQDAGRDLELGPQVVQMPAQIVDQLGALRDEPLAVIDQQPDLELRSGQPGDRQSVCGWHPSARANVLRSVREVRIARAHADGRTAVRATAPLTNLKRLEAESIAIMREAVAEAARPVMLYSVGKDSSVMLHLARKAFYPGKPPFPLLHIDTTWKFRAMYEFRDRTARELGLELLVHVYREGLEQGIGPFTHSSQVHTYVMKTLALRQALDHHGFDVALGGARRDEERSRAKERIFSFRSAQHRWDPKDQRPELWSVYNARKRRGESIRVFPLSNWTELDVWHYIYRERIPVVPLYLATYRPVVSRDGVWLMVDDDRMPLEPGERPQMRRVRFRTLGCYPLTGAVESDADTLEALLAEMLVARTSERHGRMIDHDEAGSMERKKQEGYF
jgi:sulfate adenylyltransferase subunit 2